MIKNKLPCFVISAMLFMACGVPTQQDTKDTLQKPARYELVKDWPQLPTGFLLGNPSGIGVDHNQNIFVFHRAYRKWILPCPKDSFITSPTILMLDRNSGKILNSWGANLFIMPHGLKVDKDDNIWVTDVWLHQVFKFSHDGTLLMKLGKAHVSGNDSTHFNLPTDVAISPDGSFYVSDGYGNSRVVKFSATGKYLFEWGKKGNKPGEFVIPHSINLDVKGNVYVADRENSRIQVFNPEGIFLKEWDNEKSGKLYALAFDKTKTNLFAVDYLMNDTIPKGSDIFLFDTATIKISQFGRSGSYNGPICRYHDLVLDDEGSIYVGDILGNRIQKFRKVPAWSCSENVRSNARSRK
jgi:DNA-binding beta-propeller fold protein YncE